MESSTHLPPHADTVDATAHHELVPVQLPYDTPIFLVGMMGAGKSTIGRKLAKVLKRDFIDLDQELEARCGVRITVIFAIEGIKGFRRREAAVLAECTQKRNTVLATGGGAVLSPQSRRYLRERGVVVYLRANVDELYRRVCRNRNRPLLANADPLGTLKELMAARQPMYEAVADLTLDTGSMEINDLIKILLPQLHAYKKQVSCTT